MFRRFAVLFVVILTLAVGLTACGSDAVLPTYPGGTTTAISPDLSKQMTDSMAASVKNGTVNTYATSDAPDKAKSTIADSFKKNGWDDKSKDMNLDAAGATSGISYLGYQSGDKVAVALLIPGAAASALGATGVDANGTLVMIISGSAK